MHKDWLILCYSRSNETVWKGFLNVPSVTDSQYSDAAKATRLISTSDPESCS